MKHSEWSQAQAAEYAKGLGPWSNKVPAMGAPFVVYKIVVSTVFGPYTYIGQTENLKRRIEQHNLRYDESLRANLIDINYHLDVASNLG